MSCWRHWASWYFQCHLTQNSTRTNHLAAFTCSDTLLYNRQQSRSVSDIIQQPLIRLINCRPPWFQPNVYRYSMCTSKAAKHHCIHTLPRERAISYAVQALYTGCVEWHAEHPQWPSAGDGSVCAVLPRQIPPMCSRCADLKTSSNTGKWSAGWIQSMSLASHMFWPLRREHTFC